MIGFGVDLTRPKAKAKNPPLPVSYPYFSASQIQILAGEGRSIACSWCQNSLPRPDKSQVDGLPIMRMVTHKTLLGTVGDDMGYAYTSLHEQDQSLNSGIREKVTCSPCARNNFLYGDLDCCVVSYPYWSQPLAQLVNSINKPGRKVILWTAPNRMQKGCVQYVRKDHSTVVKPVAKRERSEASERQTNLLRNGGTG